MDHFGKKPYRSIVLAWIIAISWALAFQKPWIALSVTLGAALTTVSLAVLQWVVESTFVPGSRKPMKRLAAMGTIKYVVLGTLLYAIVRCDQINLPAFVGGVLLVHFAIISRFVGIRLTERWLADSSRGLASAVHGKEN
ncbi:MAG: ATP synthase subunit I [Armatimonadota bacterium]